MALQGAPTEGDDGAVLQTMAEQLRTGMVTEMGGDIGGDPQDDELSDDSADEDFVLTRKSTLVARKYKKLSKAADLDKLLFQDDYFVVSPLEGTVPPYGHVQVWSETVSFTPHVPACMNLDRSRLLKVAVDPSSNVLLRIVVSCSSLLGSARTISASSLQVRTARWRAGRSANP